MYVNIHSSYIYICKDCFICSLFVLNGDNSCVFQEQYGSYYAYVESTAKVSIHAV